MRNYDDRKHNKQQDHKFFFEIVIPCVVFILAIIMFKLIFF